MQAALRLPLLPPAAFAFGYGAPRKRALLTAQRVAEEVCLPVPHRQLVFTISLSRLVKVTQDGMVLYKAGFKFGRWLDLYQRILDTPVRPVDG